ncbi:capsular biosynthesis protein [Paenibacillus sp. P3E]|uniref:sugar transferase n=1 Tax=Paenibacillus sp. P3E TaxID=1349435 RepID=UPI00093D2FDE|nr:sugar transferase [Paenibacillus sp. P3E]OKP89377.1 capsular biosynthesis protein [Paenibacillus sp. P3E]
MHTVLNRLIDILFSVVAMLFLWPFFVIIALWIKMNSKGPVLFKQKRIGLYKKEFFILKFRTMKTDSPSDMPTHLLQNPEVFITKAGRFLRKYSLDELPQIINIFRGEMSIIGPRPALWNQTDLIDERDKYGANNIKPGLTGLAQINGRDELSDAIKAQYDGEYVEKKSFKLDFEIFLKTIFKVSTAKGIVEGAKK